MKKTLLFVVVLALLAMLALPIAAQDAQTVVFWSSEFQPERVERQEAIIAAFEEANPGVTVELAVMDENLMDQLMAVNIASGTTPDVILHPIQLSAKWVDQGVLDPARAAGVIESLGMDTFSEGALALAEVEGGYASVPSDGWGQMLLFRKDLFDAASLPAPDSYEAIMTAAETLNDPDNGTIGFCGANSAGEVFTWQVFEHVALANGASFVDADGNITFDSPEMVEAIQFYVDLMNNAGQTESDWYWLQTRAEYLAGNCAMTMWSPFILDEMAGLRDSVLPTCEECADDPAYIARNTGVVSAISGYSNDTPAAWGSTFNIGISPDAPEAADTFVEFWFNEGYLDALGVAAEGKFPMRRGTPDNATEFVDGWAMLDVGVDTRAPLSDFYDADTLATIVAGSDGYSRMGFDVGQSTLASAVGAQFFIQENLVAAINGEISAEEAAENIQIEIEDLQFDLEE
ncbi:MAG: bicyclomycin resistance protein [Anaerolineaceae bacterium]|nr:bicyclomycin resistance protein [Anaerolineaceae bacterium]